MPEDTLSFGTQTQRYIRAQRTRSKCRRCFTVLHHHTSPSRLHFSYTQFRKTPLFPVVLTEFGKGTSGLKSVENDRDSALEECTGDAGRVGMVTRRNLLVKVEGSEADVKALDEIVRA